MKHRVRSLLLALALLWALLPWTALEARAETLTGSCGAAGSNLTWSLNTQTGLLTISGSGAMEDYEWNTPWSDYSDRITALSLPTGLTSIGSWAFHNCAGLTTLTLPATLAAIGSGAFDGCVGLTEVSFPAGLTSIGESAFGFCASLTALDLPAGLTTLGRSAFTDCTGLTTVRVAAQVTDIGELAFSGCTGLTAITVAADNPSYSSDAAGVLFNKDKTVLLQYPCGRTGTYAIPGGVTAVAEGAFGSALGLTAITFPAGLTAIGSQAFSGCLSLAEARLPAGLAQMGEYCFGYCDSLRAVTLPGSLNRVPTEAFFGCAGLETVTFGEGIAAIGDSAFYGCAGLTALSFPKSLTSIEDCAFFDCAALETVTFREGLTEIGAAAFSGTGLTTVSLPASLTRIGEDAFFYSALRALAVHNADCLVYAVNREYSSGSYPVPVDVPVTTTLGSPDRTLVFGPHDPDWETAGLVEDHYRCLENYAGTCGYAFYALGCFSDVKAGKYYELSVAWAAGEGITSGTGEGKFSPNRPCTREQIVTFLWNASGKPEPAAGSNPFRDVKAGKYYYKAVLWAYQQGITTGVTENRFGVGEACTRAQAVTFLWNARNHPAPETTENPFADVKTDQYFYRAVLWALERGVTGGTSATAFSPNETCTRGQIVTFLFKAFAFPEE